MNDSFIFYASFAEAIKSVPVEHRLQCYEALTDYALTGEYDDTDVFVRIIMAQAVPQIDANFKRREDGSKGGRPKKNSTGITGKKPMVIENAETKKPMVIENAETQKPNVNVNVECRMYNDNDNDNDLKENTPTSRSKKENTPKFNFKKALLELGVSEPIADEWISIRKKKRGINSEFALKAVVDEANKAGISLQEAIEFAAKKQWVGFQADWYFNSQYSAKPTQRGGGGFMTDAEAQAICDAGMKLHEFIGRNRQ